MRVDDNAGLATTRAPDVAVALPTPPDAAIAVAGPWPLKLTDIAFPVLPATLALGRPVAGIAVADASPPKDTAIAAEQSQPSEFQPNDASTKADTASLVAASELTVALRDGGEGFSGGPPLVTPEPGALEVLTDSEGALLAVDEVGTVEEVGAELTGADEAVVDELLSPTPMLGPAELVAVVDDSGTALTGEAVDEIAPDVLAATEDTMLALLEAATPGEESLAPAELVSTALVTISSTAEPATATARQPTAKRTLGSFILPPAPRGAWTTLVIKRIEANHHTGVTWTLSQPTGYSQGTTDFSSTAFHEGFYLAGRA